MKKTSIIIYVVLKIIKIIMLRLFILLLIPCFAFPVEEYKINIKDHVFEPNIIIVPANKKIKLLIHNQDNEAEEFESFDLRREKIIPASDIVKINIGPLEPGEYKFFGEFHSKTAHGVIKVE